MANTEKIVCKNCGAVYKCTLVPAAEPDTDREMCWTCGKLLQEWDESRYHHLFEIVREGIVPGSS